MKKQSHLKTLFNSILRLHSRYSKKLQRLVREGINLRKQGILSRRLAKMQAQMQGLFNAIKATSATAALAGACIMTLPQTAQAQTFATPLTSPFGLGNIGSYSNPSFADLDNDGDLDMLSGHSDGDFYYFKNNGTASLPAFANSIKNPFGLTAVESYSSPSFADIDNDGDFDIFTGEINGNFFYFENTGNASTPAFADSIKNPFGLSYIAVFLKSSFADLDNDGDLDILIGEVYGGFYYYENTGSAASPTFVAPQNNPFGINTVGDIPSPSFADIDNDGDLDLLSGAESGNFFYFNNTGTPTVPAFTALQINPFGLSNVGNTSTPSFADLDNDGDQDMLSGEKNGSFVYFENTSTATSIAAASLTTLIQVHPNPSQGIFSIVNTVGTNNTYTVTDLAGKQIKSIQNTEKNTVINLSALDKGVYFLNISNEKSSQTVKLLLQ